MFKLFHILTTNRIKYVLYDGTNFEYDKSPNFVKLMLEYWIFHKTNVLIRTIKLILFITNLHSKGLERNIGDLGAQKKHYLIFLIGFWHSKWKYVILECQNSLTFLLGSYLNKTFKICSIDLNNSLQHLLVESLNIHILLSLFSILKHSLC